MNGSPFKESQTTARAPSERAVISAHVRCSDSQRRSNASSAASVKPCRLRKWYWRRGPVVEVAVPEADQAPDGVDVPRHRVGQRQVVVVERFAEVGVEPVADA